MRLLLPFLLILPGAIAIRIAHAANTTVVRNENGAIYHEITVVARRHAAGRGLVPARLDPAPAIRCTMPAESRSELRQGCAELADALFADRPVGIGSGGSAWSLMSGSRRELWL